MPARASLATLLALAPGLALAHGDQPQILDIAFPGAFPGEAWALSDNQGIFAVGEAGTRWLCEDAIEPAAGVRAVATLDASRWILSTEVQLWRTDDGGCSFRGLPGLLAVHLYGDIVRVLTKADDPEPIRAWLAAAGITAEVTPVAVDMETAFAFLAELGAAA